MHEYFSNKRLKSLKKKLLAENLKNFKWFSVAINWEMLMCVVWWSLSSFMIFVEKIWINILLIFIQTPFVRQNTPHPKELKAKAHKLFASASSGAAALAAPPPQQQQQQPQQESQEQEENAGQNETPDQSLNMQEGDIESLPTDSSIDKVFINNSLNICLFYW